MQLQLSDELNDIITYSKEEAMRMGSYTISTDHLLLGIVRHRQNNATEALTKLNINLQELKTHIETNIQKSEIIPFENADRITLSKASENVLKIMFLESRAFGKTNPEPYHLLLSILRSQQGCAIEYMQSK